MPELPEVENMRMLLLRYCNIQIKKVLVNNANLRLKINDYFISDIQNSYIDTISRKGKFLIFHLSNKKVIIMHAGMSGKFLATDKLEINKHDHIVFYMNNEYIIKYNDPRRFGLALTFDSLDLALKSKLFNNIGLDAINHSFTEEYLKNKITNLKAPIKNILLNQSIISGIGNIYASEILFYSRIHPSRLSNTLSKIDLCNIVKFTKDVLNKSIELGGSTLKDYALPDGKNGYFQNNFAVYNRESQPCLNCRTPIQKIILCGRSTYYCKKDQI